MNGNVRKYTDLYLFEIKKRNFLFFRLLNSSQYRHTLSWLYLQDKRITVSDALAHPYLDEGRLRYHSCMCSCCYTTGSGMRQYTGEFEPTTPHSFDDQWERNLNSVQQVKGIYLFHICVSNFHDLAPLSFFPLSSFSPLLRPSANNVTKLTEMSV